MLDLYKSRSEKNCTFIRDVYSTIHDRVINDPKNTQCTTQSANGKVAVSWLKILGLGLGLAARILSHETATLPPQTICPRISCSMQMSYLIRRGCVPCIGYMRSIAKQYKKQTL